MFESSRTTPLVFYRVGIFVWSVVCLVIFFKLSAFCSASLDGFSVLFSKRCFYFLEIEHIYIFEQSVKYTINDIQHILSIDAKTVLDCFTKVYFSIVHSDWSTTHIEEMIAISWCVIKNHPQFMIKESSVTKCSVDAIQSFYKPHQKEPLQERNFFFLKKFTQPLTADFAIFGAPRLPGKGGPEGKSATAIHFLPLSRYL